MSLSPSYVLHKCYNTYKSAKVPPGTKVPGRDPKWPKITKNDLQTTITLPSDGLRSSSRAHPIQVDHAGAHGTGPDRFRAVPDHFLMKIQLFSKNDFFQKMTFSKKKDFFKKWLFQKKYFFPWQGQLAKSGKSGFFDWPPPTFLKKYGTYGLLPEARHTGVTRRFQWYI